MERGREHRMLNGVSEDVRPGADSASATPRDHQAGAGDGGRRWRWRDALSFRNISLVYVGIALVIAFAIWTPDTFLTSTTAQLIAQQQVVTALVAVGLVVPLSAGVFDLSVGYGVGLSAILTAWLLGVQEESLGVAILVAVLSGIALGCVNGFLVVVVGIDSFIATLATGSLAAAAILGISDNQQILFMNQTFSDMGNGKVAGIPVVVFYILLVATALWFVLQYTPWGRRVYAVGGSRETARLAGVKVSRIVFTTLVVSGLCAALAGVVVSASVGAGSPGIGPGYLLPAFAAAFLGSTQLKNGRFNVWGTVLAVYVLGIGIKGLQLVTGATWVPDLFNGIALAAAVGLAVLGVRHRALLARFRRRSRGRAGGEPRADAGAAA
jgi:ribose transport system permease protein